MYDSDSDSMIMSLKDWRQALTAPPTYRIGNSSLRINTKLIAIVFLVIFAVLLIIYYSVANVGHNYAPYNNVRPGFTLLPDVKDGVTYNSTYPLTKPERTPTGISFRIGVVSDLDTESKSKKDPNTWVSHLLKGYLSWNPSLNRVSVTWDKVVVELESTLSQGGRGMELSELVVFNGKLYAFDDRTGVIYEIVGNRVIPWVLLTDGNGYASKGFKCEWATVKDDKLIIGGLGKEWTNNKGEFINSDPQWVKEVTVRGEVTHLNWRDKYLALRKSVGITFPGYMIHESAVWSRIHSRWFFLPRRYSKQTYRDDTDELMGTNIFLSTDAFFQDIKVSRIGDVVPSHGFSSFKFIPGSDDSVIVAIKSEELKGSAASYIMAFTTNGKILLPETKFADEKYEGGPSDIEIGRLVEKRLLIK